MLNTRNAIRISFIFILFVSLNLLAQSKPYSGAEYRTKASHIYGRFEVRMKSAPGSGMLTSFFTYHDSFPFSVSNWNEIDIEAMGRYSNETQFNTITPGRIDHVHRQPLKFNPHIAFHIFAFEWTPDYVAWFVDGYGVYRQTVATSIRSAANKKS
jgi:beta-glucanase (GH16 family)